MPYVSENEKLCKQLEEKTKDRERLQAENSRLQKRISATEEHNRLESVTRATTSNLVTVPETEEHPTDWRSKCRKQHQKSICISFSRKLHNPRHKQ